ncbi:MAG: hypothetical protein ACRD3E_08770 [Terriglobales bacterium]
MKRFIVVLALVTAAGVASAQSTANQQQKPAGAQNSGAAATSQQAPAGKTAPAGQAAAPAEPAPLPGTKHPPQAKTQDEMKAFQDANAKTTPAEVETAADAFAQAHPDSELRVLLYRKAMYDYQNVNDADKAIEMGRKLLALDPNNPEGLVMTATFLSERTRDTDLDRDERLNEGSRDAEKALQTIETDLMLPGTVTQEQATAIRTQMKGMAYAALGTISIAKKDFPAAEKNLKQAADLYPGDPLVWLRLAYSLDKENKFAEAVKPADNCIQYSAQQPQVANLCRQEKERVSKLAQAPQTAAPPPTSPQPQTSVPK